MAFIVSSRIILQLFRAQARASVPKHRLRTPLYVPEVQWGGGQHSGHSHE